MGQQNYGVLGPLLSGGIDTYLWKAFDTGVHNIWDDYLWGVVPCLPYRISLSSVTSRAQPFALEQSGDEARVPKRS